MPSEDKLTEQITIAAEGIKQLVEQGKKTLSATEHLARGVSPAAATAFAQAASSPVAREFAQAGLRNPAVPPAVHEGISQIQVASKPPAAKALRPDQWPQGMPSLPSPAVSQTVHQEVAQIQAASQPQAKRSFPESFEAIQARMLHAVSIGADPIAAARTGGGMPLKPSQWPAGMPGLPVGSPGNPAPPGMPGLPTPAVPSPPSPQQASGGGEGGGFFSMPSFRGVAAAAGLGLGAIQLIKGQLFREFNAGSGMAQWNKENANALDYQTSPLRLLTQGAIQAGNRVATQAAKLIGGEKIPDNIPPNTKRAAEMIQEMPGAAGVVYGAARSIMAGFGLGGGDDDTPDNQHNQESKKTSVGDGPK